MIDPAQAFGTGAHATTRLCLELLLALAGEEPARGAVLDVGAGSGVLAIAAAKLGYGPVLALDNDPLSVAGDQANARLADVDARGAPVRSAPRVRCRVGRGGALRTRQPAARLLLLRHWSRAPCRRRPRI